jgi:hypothetical protein
LHPDVVAGTGDKLQGQRAWSDICDQPIGSIGSGKGAKLRRLVHLWSAVNTTEFELYPPNRSSGSYRKQQQLICAIVRSMQAHASQSTKK